jgi:hypothetical protein
MKRKGLKAIGPIGFTNTRRFPQDAAYLAVLAGSHLGTIFLNAT